METYGVSFDGFQPSCGWPMYKHEKEELIPQLEREVERWRAEFEEGVDPTQEPERYAALANEQRAVQYAGDEVVEFMRVLVSKPWL